MRSVFVLAVLTIALGGCSNTAERSPWAADVVYTGSVTSTIQSPGDVKYYSSDELYHLATEYFNRGSFGTAAEYFRTAVERAPKDASAWVGLAASYDRIGRFDLADQAYRHAIRLNGETIEILNNRGYSYMLRGNLIQARVQFKRALRLDPDNAIIWNNLELLNGSRRFIERSGEK
ncbi:MAG: tetratricopeptide repeat protein [Alphaproteobacteria bacterium]